MPSNKLPISLRYCFRTDLLLMLIGLFIWRNRYHIDCSLGVTLFCDVCDYTERPQ